MVYGTSEGNADEVVKALEYWEVNDNSWHDMTGSSIFGSSAGFPCPPASQPVTSKFRVKFNEGYSELKVNILLKDVDTDDTLVTIPVNVKFES